LDGEQSSQYYAQASLKEISSGKETTIVSRTKFDGYVVEAQVDASGFAKGSYRKYSYSTLVSRRTSLIRVIFCAELIARESNEAGEIVDTLTQSLTIN
jgi:hypothetical protein